MAPKDSFFFESGRKNLRSRKKPPLLLGEFGIQAREDAARLTQRPPCTPRKEVGNCGKGWGTRARQEVESKDAQQFLVVL